MAGKLQRFQTLMFQGWAKDIDKQNNLGRYMQLAPQSASPVIIELLATNQGKNLDIFLSQFSIKEFETDQDYTWDVVGSTRRNIPLKYAVAEDGQVVTTSTTGLIGRDKRLFELVFAEEGFFDGELLYGELNEAYPLRVMGPVQKRNTEYVYTVQLFGTNTDGMPAEQLLPGKRFSYGHAPVSRGLSRDVGGLRHATPASMRNEFSQIRLSHKMSGDLMDQKIAMVVPIVNSDGKVADTTMWMHLENWEFEKTWSEYKSDVIAYSRSNRNENGEYMDFDKSGEVIREGDGIYAQTEVANVRYYNRFSIGLIEDILYNLTENKYGFGDRTFVLKTGQQGAIKFHKAVKEETSGWFNMQVDAASIGAIAKTSSALHKNALKAGFQFTEWLAPNNIAVKVEVDPSYDDRVRNKILLDGKPAQSSRFDIWDMGTSQSANIQKVVAKNRPEVMQYRWGLRNPWNGQYNNENASYDEDSASMSRMGTFGAIVWDPTRTMSLIPSVLVY